MAVDPVCKMTVDPPKAAAQSSFFLWKKMR